MYKVRHTNEKGYTRNEQEEVIDLENSKANDFILWKPWRPERKPSFFYWKKLNLRCLIRLK